MPAFRAVGRRAIAARMPGQFHQIEDIFLSSAQRLSCFYGRMQASEGASLKATPWLLAPDRAGAVARPRSAARTRARASDGATSLRAVIASSAFLVLFSVSLMIGGHAAIDPLLRSAVAARETKGIGDLILPLPDGKFCRHMSFDNATAEIVEGRVGPCPENLAPGLRSYRGFAWGGEAADPER